MRRRYRGRIVGIGFVRGGNRTSSVLRPDTATDALGVATGSRLLECTTDEIGATVRS